jgi:hypothetical protein
MPKKTAEQSAPSTVPSPTEPSPPPLLLDPDRPVVNIYEQLAGGGSQYAKTIGGSIYEVRMGLVNPHDLRLAPVDSTTKAGNPRFWMVHKALLAENPNHGPMTEAEQIDYLTKTGDVVTRKQFEVLKSGMRYTKERQDDIHVQSDGTVIEGNRGTVVAQLLNREDPSIFNAVRVVCYPPGVKLSDIRLAMGRIHVAQKARWASGNRNDLLRTLRDEDRLSVSDIASHLGMGETTVKIGLETGDLLAKYQEEYNDHRPSCFTAFYKVVTTPKLHRLICKQKDNKAINKDYDPKMWARYCTWVKNDKLDDSRVMPKLAEIVKLPGMLAVIDEKGLVEALNQAKTRGTKADLMPILKEVRAAKATVEHFTPTTMESLPMEWYGKARQATTELLQAIDNITPEEATSA